MTTAEYSLLPIDQVVASGTNPRRHFDKKALDELAASIKDHGVIEPVVVRRNGGAKYILVAGERRWRAAQLAGRKEIPAVVRELTDAQALEIQVIENLQREDIHPLDEAQGYARLREVTGQEIDDIADKVGKSASYVYQRVKLLELSAEWQKKFLAGEITAGHAIQLARLTAADQKEVQDWWENNGSFSYGDLGQGAVPSVRGLADHISNEIHMKLGAAPWKKDDVTLLPKAGACTTCPKRTGASPELFPDVKDRDVCTDRVCFKAKEQEFMVRTIKAAENKGETLVKVSNGYSSSREKLPAGTLSQGQWEQAAKDSCTHVEKAVIVYGENRGQVVTICRKKECRKHLGKYAAPRRSSADDKKWEQSREREKAKRDRDNAIRLRVGAEVLAKTPAKLGRDDLEEIAVAFYCLSYEGQEQVAKVLGWKEPTGGRQQEVVAARKAVAEMGDAELARFLVLVAIAEDMGYGYNKRPFLTSFAKRYKVDIEKLAKAYAKDAKLAAKAQKKGAKPIAGVCRFCKCTETSPCNPPCSWADKTQTLCSAPACRKKAAAEMPKAKAAGVGRG